MTTLRALVASTLCLYANDASACGGLFCETSTPPQQEGERIIFVDEGQDDAGTPLVAAYVQIRYIGKSSGFAWIVPVQSAPTVSLASAELFDALDAATAPIMTFVTPNGDVVTTSGEGGGSGCGGGAGGATREVVTESVDGGSEIRLAEVDVVGSDSVGPFETVTIQSEDAGAVQAWLVAHNYQMPAGTDKLLQPYAEAGMMFVALRLQDGQGVGAIEPIVIHYAGDACVPIRLTPVATQPVLPITIIAIGSSRFYSMNFADIEIDYNDIEPVGGFDSKSGYQYFPTSFGGEVLRGVRAVNGHGFVTTMAGSSRHVFPQSFEASSLLLQGNYVTRLYTLLPAESMTVDPIFSFADGPDVSREHLIELDRNFSVAGPDSDDDSAATSNDGSGCGCSIAAARSAWPLLLTPLFILFLRRHASKPLRLRRVRPQTASRARRRERDRV